MIQPITRREDQKMSVLDALFRRQEERKQEAELSLSDIVLRLADDEDADLDADAVQQALAEVDWTAQDLQQAVHRRRRINAIQRTQERHQELLAERPAIRDAIKAADDKLEKARIAHRQEVAPLRAKLQEISDAQQAAFHAKSELRQLISPKDAERINQAQKESQQYRHRLDEAERRVTAAKIRVENAVEPRQGWAKPGETVVNVPERKAALAALERAEAVAQQAREELNAAVARSNELYEQATS